MIQKKKFVKTFRNTKTVQLVLLLLLEATYVLVLTLNPALGTKLFEDRTLFILCTLSWILALFNLIWLLYDFYKLRTFAEESHCLLYTSPSPRDWMWSLRPTTPRNLWSM